MGNQTTAPLAAGRTFTGPWDDVSAYDSLVKYISTDQNCIVFVDFSADRQNVDSSLPYLYDTENVVPPNRLTIGRPYARLRIVNTSGSPMTYLRAGMMYGEKAPLSVALSSIIAPTADAMPVRSITEESAVAEGLYQGRFLVNKFGRNTSVGTGEDIWDGGGVYTGQPLTSSETVDLISTSDNDGAAAGDDSGALTAQIFGLDENWELQDEIVTLDGTNGANVGTITCRHTTTTANIFSVMQVGTNTSEIGAYTIAAGYTGYLIFNEVRVIGNASAALTGCIAIRKPGGVYQQRRPWGAANAAPHIDEIYGGLRLPAQTDIIIRSLTQSNTPVASANFDIKMVRNLA